MHRVGAKNQDIAGPAGDGDGPGLVPWRGLGAAGQARQTAAGARRSTVVVVPRRQPTPGIQGDSVVGQKLQGTVVGPHVVDEEDGLHIGAAAVDVAPGATTLVPVLDVLVPIKRHAVVRHLEVGLTQQLLTAWGAQQGEHELNEARVLRQTQQHGLGAAGPHDPFDDDVARHARWRGVEDEVGALVVTRDPQGLGGIVQTLKGGAGRLHVGGGKHRGHDDKAVLEKRALLLWRWPHPHSCPLHSIEGRLAPVECAWVL